MSLGQGTVDDPKGWHYDPTRNCQPVYLYVENMEHDWQMTKNESYQTLMRTGNMALPNAAETCSFQPPLPASAPLVATLVPIANSNPATPVTSAATTPMMPAVGTPTPSAAETPGPTEKQTDDETPEKEAENSADLIKQATDLLEKIKDIPMLRGFL